VRSATPRQRCGAPRSGDSFTDRPSAARRPRRRLVAGLPAVGLILLAGCASVADVTGTATQQDLVEMRGEIAAARQTAQRARADAEAAVQRAVDARVRTQGAESERQLTALTQRLDGLTTSMSELTARVDELSSRVEALGRQVRAAAPAGPAAPPSAPTTAGPVTPGPPTTPGTPGAPTAPGSTAATTTSGIEAAPTTPTPVAPPLTPQVARPLAPPIPPAVPTPATPAPPATAGTRPATNALQPQDIYQASYIDFSKGSYALAMAGFREFLRRFPDHTLAGNAQYWIGESHFSLARGHANAGQPERATQELEQAVQEFRKVLASYPRGEKAPTALYKEALALLELKQPGLAQQRLEYLVTNFPQAEETPLARERLAAIKTR
jgi:tol-pal system protein YbgF